MLQKLLILKISLVSWCFEPSQPQRVISGLTDPEDRVLMTEQLEDCSVFSAEISEWTRRDPVLAHVHEYLLCG